MHLRTNTLLTNRATVLETIVDNGGFFDGDQYIDNTYAFSSPASALHSHPNHVNRHTNCSTMPEPDRDGLVSPDAYLSTDSASTSANSRTTKNRKRRDSTYCEGQRDLVLSINDVLGRLWGFLCPRRVSNSVAELEKEHLKL